jgi:hypothetical protein
MIRVMRDPATEPHRRNAMVKAAAPYLHLQTRRHTARARERRWNADRADDHLTIDSPAAAVSEASKPKLTHEGTKDDDTVQWGRKCFRGAPPGKRP